MAIFSYEKNGISLRFGDVDTPAPEGAIGAVSRAPRIAVAVGPPDPRLRVHVQVKFGASRERSFSLRPERRRGGEQFFEGTFPDVRAGDQLSYSVYVELARADGTIRVDSRDVPGGVRH